MADTVAPEFARFVEAERRAQRLPAATRPMAEGEVFKTVFIEAGRSAELIRVAARRAAGFFRPSQRNEVVWVEGENELAVRFAEVNVKLSTGLIRIGIPVRCDQTGPATIEVLFAVGSPEQPAGLYAAAARRPNGPEHRRVHLGRRAGGVRVAMRARPGHRHRRGDGQGPARQPARAGGDRGHWRAASRSCRWRVIASRVRAR